MFKGISIKIKNALLQCQNEWNSNQIRFEILNDLKHHELQWNEVAAEHSFACAEYLSVLQLTLDKHVQCRYIIVFEQETPVGVAFFQLINLKNKKLNEILNSNYFDDLYQRFNGQLNEINFEEKNTWLCICGNLFVSGPHGFILKDEMWPQALNIFKTALRLVEAGLPKSDKIFATVVKDFPQNHVMPQILHNLGYIDFEIDPDMVLQLQSFKSFDTYLQAFSSKYRVRANSAAQKLDDVTVLNLNADEIKKNELTLAMLFNQVLKQAPVHLAGMSADYFWRLKQKMPNHFFVKGYFYNEQMVAFTSTLLCNNVLYAHHVGFDYLLNKKLALYQNMLYQLVNEAIENKAMQLNLGRDAMEIKSTLGAIPVTQKLFIKFGNSMTHFLLDSFLNLAQPKPWVQRRPFKSDTKSFEISISKK
jgi:hypothetical protein